MEGLLKLCVYSVKNVKNRKSVVTFEKHYQF
ncbi:Uncharacterised protein [Staphylococcus hominis]|nr:Uncharacterised protein [Staphylococcus hominis]